MDIKVIGSSSAGNCYLLRSGNSAILIEAGIPWKRVQKALDFNTRGIAFCLVSHSHKDHAGYVGNIMLSGIDVYGLRDVKEKYSIVHHRFYQFGVKLKFHDSGWTIQSFPCVHDVPCVGFVVTAPDGDKAVYLADSLYSPYTFGKGVTHFLISVNYARETISKDIDPAHRKHVIRDHMSLETAKKLLASNDLSRVREIWLLHLSQSNSDAEYFKTELQKLTGLPVHVAPE